MHSASFTTSLSAGSGPWAERCQTVILGEISLSLLTTPLLHPDSAITCYSSEGFGKKSLSQTQALQVTRGSPSAVRSSSSTSSRKRFAGFFQIWQPNPQVYDQRTLSLNSSTEFRCMFYYTFKQFSFHFCRHTLLSICTHDAGM